MLVPSSSFTFPSSSMWKRKFSKSKTSPGFKDFAAASASAPTQLEINLTGLPKSFSNSAATGRRENFSTTLPSGRPRCDINTQDAPPSRRKRIVGSAAAIRCVLVMAPVFLS